MSKSIPLAQRIVVGAKRSDGVTEDGLGWLSSLNTGKVMTGAPVIALGYIGTRRGITCESYLN